MPLIKATHKLTGTAIEGRAVKTASGYAFAEIDVFVSDNGWTIERSALKLPEKPGTVIDIFELYGKTYDPPVRAMLGPNGVWELARDTVMGSNVSPIIINDFEVVLP